MRHLQKNVVNPNNGISPWERSKCVVCVCVCVEKEAVGEATYLLIVKPKKYNW